MADPSGVIPKLLGIVLDGTGIAGTIVVAVNQTTGERLSLSTNSDKVVVFDAANFSSGYSNGDIIIFENVGGSVGQASITINSLSDFQQATIACAAASTVSTTL